MRVRDGLLWSGNFGRIQGNAVFNNGVHTPQLWPTDHLNRNTTDRERQSLRQQHRRRAHLRRSPQHEIQSNWIEQNNGVTPSRRLMLGNFAETGNRCIARRLHRAMVSSNTIQCPGFWCGFASTSAPILDAALEGLPERLRAR